MYLFINYLLRNIDVTQPIGKPISYSREVLITFKKSKN